MLDGGSVVTADDLVLTSGCHSALSLALLSVCQPGHHRRGIPCYYGTMQMLRGLGLKTIEIPPIRKPGSASRPWSWRWISGRSRVILVPNCNNPLGFIMPDARKRAVLNLAQRYDIVIFEDDIYGELATEYPRPRTIHSDIDGRVMLCSSFTKPSPRAAYRLDRPGRYYDKLLQMKYAASGTNVLPLSWRPVILFAKATTTATCGGCGRSISAISRSTPAGCGIFPAGSASPAEGRFMLWVELPEQVDMVCVAKQLCRLKIRSRRARCFRQRAVSQLRQDQLRPAADRET